MALASRLFPDSPCGLQDISDIFKKCEDTVATIFNIEDAVTWGDDFRMPLAVHTRDLDDLRRLDNNLEALIRLRQTQCQFTRLSVESVQASSPQVTSDSLHLLRFATHGVTVITGPQFTRNRTPPKPSPAYREAHAAVDKLLYDAYVNGHGIILPTSCLDQIVPPGMLHFSRLGLTLKKGTQSGRVTSNYSYSPLGHSVGSLNSEEVVDMARQVYGDIYLTTLFDLVAMVQLIVARALLIGLCASDVVVWSMDLKGAFTLLWFSPLGVSLLALPLLDGLTFLPIAGNFGLGMFPFAFNVVSRFIEERGRELLLGEARVYVDDIQGCCFRRDLAHDLSTMRMIITTLLGNDSVADKKTCSGRSIDWIGWSFDLDHYTVGIADKNYYKTLHGFLAVRPGEKIQVRMLHTLASWASRYSLICPVLTPFSSYLFDAFSGYKDLESRVPLPTEAYLVVVLWRLFLLLMKADPVRHTRSLHSFAPASAALYMVESDGCPEGLGFFLHRRTCSASPWKRFYAVSLFKCYDLKNDPKYQNAMEFLGILMGLLTLRWMGIVDVVVDLLGDNTASLAWSSSLKFRSGSSTSAALLFVLLSHHGGITVGNSIFRAGVLNEADGLSRGVDPSIGQYSLGPPGATSYTLSTMPLELLELLYLVDPSRPIMSEDVLVTTWERFTAVLRSLPDPR